MLNNKILQKTFVLIMCLTLLDTTASGLLIPVIMDFLNLQVSHNPQHIIKYDVWLGSGFIISISPTYLLIAPVIGYFSDRIGRKRLLIMCYAVSAVGYTLIYLGGSYGNMLGVMSGLLLFSIGSASYPLSQAILSDISMGIYKFKYFAWQAIALMSMMAVAEWSVSLLTLSWQLPLAFSICCEFACVLLGMVFLSESKKNNVADDDESDKTVVDLCALFFRRDLLITLLVYLLLMFAWGIVMQHGYSYLLNLFGSSRDTVLFSLLQSFLMIVSLLLIPFIIRKSQAFGKALKIIISVAIISLFCLWLPVAHIISGTFILLSGISFVLVAVILWSVFSDYAPMQYQGVMMCILGPLWSISWTYSGMVTTVIGNYFLCGPYLLAAILSLIALGLLSCQKYCFLK